MKRWIMCSVLALTIPLVARQHVVTVRTALRAPSACEGANACIPAQYWCRGRLVAQLNLDGRWSVHPWGLAEMAFQTPPWTRGASYVWGLLLALPTLSIESFAAGDKANHNPIFTGETA